MRSAASVTQSHLSKPDDLMGQNTTRLRKSAPWPPNISEEHVSCTAPAGRNACLKTFFKCPTPVLVLDRLQNPHVLLTLGKMHIPLHLPRETTSERLKVFRTRQSFCVFDLETCFAISISNSGPNLWCFVHLDFDTCFAPTACNSSSLIWPDLCTRHFSKPTFRPSRRPSGATNSGKNTANRHFPTFSRTCIFFLLTLSLLWSSPLWLFPPLLFHLSILSEVWVLNFLRYVTYSMLRKMEEGKQDRNFPSCKQRETTWFLHDAVFSDMGKREKWAVFCLI